MASLPLADSAFGVAAAAPGGACRLGIRNSCSLCSSHLLLPQRKIAWQCLVYKRLRIRARSRHTICHLIDNARENWKSWILEDWEWADGSQRAADPNEARLITFCVSVMERSNGISSASNNPTGFFSKTCAIEHPGPLAEKSCSFLPSAPRGLQKARYAQQILVFVGRALLILGVGLSLSTPALARPAASQVNANPAGDVQNRQTQEAEAAPKNEEKASNAALQNLEESEKALSDKFWNGITIPEGSRLQSLKSHIDSHPNDARALAILLHAVMEQKDMLRALTLLERLVEVEPDELEWKFLKARTHESIGELSMAKESFEELLRIRPLSARVLQALIIVLNQMGEGKDALEYIETALSRAITENKNTEAGNLRILLGQIYAQKGNFEEAVKQFGMMIDQDPNDFRPYLCQGLLYSLLDEKVKAEQYLEKYRQLCPQDFPSRSYLDDLMFKVKSDGRRDEMFQNAFKNNPKGKTPKPMKKPSIGGKSFSSPQEQGDDF